MVDSVIVCIENVKRFLAAGAAALLNSNIHPQSFAAPTAPTHNLCSASALFRLLHIFNRAAALDHISKKQAVFLIHLLFGL